MGREIFISRENRVVSGNFHAKILSRGTNKAISIINNYSTKLSRTLTHSQQGVAELAMSSCTTRLSGIIVL